MPGTSEQPPEYHRPIPAEDINWTQEEPAHHRQAPIAEQQAEEGGHPSRRIVVLAVANVAVFGVAAAALYKKGIWPFDRSTEQSSAPASEPPSTGAEKQAGSTEHLPGEFDPAKRKTMLTDTWSMLGAKRTDKGAMKVEAAGWAIRRVDGDGYIPRHPQLLYGPRIDTKGNDFGVAARISDVGAEQATVYMHSTPDVILDEERYAMPAVSATVKGDKVIINVYDGRKNKPAETYTIPATGAPNGADIWFQQKGDHIIVGSGNEKKIIETVMFKKSKQVIFGADGTFALNSLDIYTTSDEPVEIKDTSKRKLPAIDPNGFQGIANSHGREDLTIVDAVDLSSIDDSDELLGNIGGLKPEMAGKLGAILKNGPDAKGNISIEDFDFTELDAIIDLAMRNGRKLEIHTLIFQEAYSEDVKSFLETCAKTGNKEAAANFMIKTIKIVVGKYKDVFETWDVVNEPMGATENDEEALNPRKGIWSNAFGGQSYIELACKTAKEVGAKRVRINENALETWKERRAEFIDTIVRPLAKKGYLDAVGLQGHIDPTDYSEWFNDDTKKVDATYVRDDVGVVIKEFAQADVEVDITELSIDAKPNGKQTLAQVQGAVAAGFAAAAMESKNVKNLGLWGLVSSPRYMTSERNADGTFALGNDTPWDWKDGKPSPKAAYIGGIRAGLRGEI